MKLWCDHPHRNTDFTDFGGAVRDNLELNQFLALVTALGYVGLPDDIVGAIVSFVSDYAISPAPLPKMGRNTSRRMDFHRLETLWIHVGTV
jgi:hypothetical protein